MSNTAVTGVYPCYKNQFQIKVPGSGSAADTYEDIADLETFSVAFDNGVEEWNPFEHEGWVRRMMTAKSVTITVNGKRNVGDDGNDYVASMAFKNGREAEADFQWTFPDGTVVEFAGSPINVTELGSGDSTNVGPLAFEVLSNGKPTVTPAT